MTTERVSGLHVKLAAVASEIQFVGKDKTNTAQHYDYVSDTAFVQAVRDKLFNRGVTIVPRVVPESIQVVERGGKGGYVSTCAVEYTFTDFETGESVTACTVGQGFDTLDKGIYKAMTGALKYVLRQTFLIPTGDDAEAPTPQDISEPTEQQRQTVKQMMKSLRMTDTEKELAFVAHGIERGAPATREQVESLIADLMERASK